MTAALRTLEVVGIWAIALAALNACRTSPRPKDESPIPAASHPRGDSDLASSGRLLVRLDGVPICSLALEGETVYFVTPDDTEPSGDTRNALWSVSTRGGPPVRRFSDRAFGSAPTLAGEFAYFLGRNGALRRARVAQGPATNFVAAQAIARALKAPLSSPDETPPPCSKPTGALPWLATLVAADDRYVFWIDRARGALMRVSHSGLAPSVLARGAGIPVFAAKIAQDETFIYWAIGDVKGSRLFRLRKDGSAAVEEVSGSLDTPALFAVARGQAWWLEGITLRGSAFDSRDLAALGAPRRSDGGVPLSDLCDIAAAEGRLVVSFCGRSGAGHLVGQTGQRPPRILAPRMTSALGLAIGPDDIYFVELGEKASIKSRADRLDCCSVRALPFPPSP